MNNCLIDHYSEKIMIVEEEMVLKMSVILMCQMEKQLSNLSYCVMKTQKRDNLVPCSLH